MILHDRPIKEIKKDILGRKEFVHGFVKTIDEYISSGNNKINEGLVVGLQGSWGCGKTSLINMISEVIQSHDYSDRYLVVRLEPWANLDRESLLLEFFRTLFSATLYQDNFDKASAVNIVKDLLQKNSYYISKAISKLSAYLLGGFRPSEKAIKNFLFQESFDQKKVKVTKALESFPKTIIYFIDDIDRLSDEEIALLFRLIKSIADFPNVIYILSYDYDIVCEALSRTQGGGDTYLKKIIQVPFDVPRPSQEVLCEYCTIGLIMSLNLDDGKKERYKLFVRSMIVPYLKTIRDCNRYLNVLSFRYQAYGKNLNITDLICITVLEVFDKNSYDIIYVNKEIFYMKRDKNERRKELTQKLEKVEQRSKRILGIMFPDILPLKNISDDTLLRTIFVPVVHPLKQEENFNLYFQMYTLERQTTWDDIYRTLICSSTKEMTERFLYWHENRVWWDVADQINKSFAMTRNDRVLYINKTQCKNILKALSCMEKKLVFAERINMQENIDFFLPTMLKNVLVNDKRKLDIQFLKELLNDEEISIGFTYEIMKYLSEGKQWDPWHTSEWGVESKVEVSEEEFCKIKECLAERLKKSIENKSLFSLGAFNDLLNCFWMIMPDMIKSYTYFNDAYKERTTIGVMMCVNCVYGINNSIYWKKHPERWQLITNRDRVLSIFNEVWTEEQIRKQNKDMQIIINATKQLFEQEVVYLEEVNICNKS